MDKQVEEYLKKVKEKQARGEELLESEKLVLRKAERGTEVTMRAIEEFQHYMD